MNRTDNFSLLGKKALIANPEAPYGAQIAEGFCEAGAEVFLCGGDAAKMEAMAGRFREDGHKVSVLMEYRQGTEAAAAGLAEAARSKMGRIDSFVYVDPGCFPKGWDIEFEEISENMQATQTGLMLTIKNIGSLMAGQGSGAVLFITDYAALVGCDVHNYDKAPEIFDEGFSLLYGFLKGGYVNYTRQAAGYLGENGVRCNCIAYAPLGGGMPDGFEQAFIRYSHLKRMATEQDVKDVAVFFASDASAYITGVTLPVDGGYTSK